MFECGMSSCRVKRQRRNSADRSTFRRDVQRRSAREEYTSHDFLLQRHCSIWCTILFPGPNYKPALSWKTRSMSTFSPRSATPRRTSLKLERIGAVRGVLRPRRPGWQAAAVTLADSKTKHQTGRSHEYSPGCTRPLVDYTSTRLRPAKLEAAANVIGR